MKVLHKCDLLTEAEKKRFNFSLHVWDLNFIYSGNTEKIISLIIRNLLILIINRITRRILYIEGKQRDEST